MARRSAAPMLRAVLNSWDGSSSRPAGWGCRERIGAGEPLELADLDRLRLTEPPADQVRNLRGEDESAWTIAHVHGC
jgi:hypothetical protein